MFTGDTSTAILPIQAILFPEGTAAADGATQLSRDISHRETLQGSILRADIVNQTPAVITRLFKSKLDGQSDPTFTSANLELRHRNGQLSHGMRFVHCSSTEGQRLLFLADY